MKRKLRAFGEGADHQQQDRRQRLRRRFEFGQSGNDDAELAAAAEFGQQNQSGQQGEAAAARDQQGLLRRFAAGGFVVIKTNQQKRKDAGRLPAQKQQEHIVGAHTTDHRQHEQAQQRIKPLLARIASQIAAGIDENRAAYAGDHQQQQCGKAVHSPGKRDA